MDGFGLEIVEDGGLLPRSRLRSGAHPDSELRE